MTMADSMNGPVSKLARCAIYARKSSEHNLDLAFTSLDAQREACEAYIKSQAAEGWRLLARRYDDGGISGGSLQRPALQALLADIRDRKVDIVVVYKVDRLTRSLSDFAKLIELFDAHAVSFVSVTQSFNTSSSMGRLTLNVLLSFAQFERELIGERVRDKIAASKRKGLWVGGPVPLGYAVVDKKVVVVPAEAEVVRTIYARYLELGSVRALVEDLDRRGIRSKSRQLANGRIIGGGRFGVGALAYLLKNRFYLGEVVYRGEVHRGDHTPILGQFRQDGEAPVAIDADNASTAPAQSNADLTTITIAWTRPHPSAVKGIIHVPAHNTPMKRSLRDALLIAITNARQWVDIWRTAVPPASRRSPDGRVRPNATSACWRRSPLCRPGSWQPFWTAPRRPASPPPRLPARCPGAGPSRSGRSGLKPRRPLRRALLTGRLLDEDGHRMGPCDGSSSVYLIDLTPV
jgi:DNA invertase Pin-like site-specific DNA recombinase